MQKLKQKVYAVVWVLGLGLCVGFVLLQIELIGWNTLITLEYDWLYGHMEFQQIEYKHQESVLNYIKWNFGPHAKLATAIFTAESGLRCNAISSTGDYGVSQINAPSHPQYTIAQMLDCKTNVEIAGRIFKQQGNFSAWSAYKNGSYRKFLTN